MPSIHETAYPRLRSQVSLRELAELYTPTTDELVLADEVTRGAVAQLGFLVLLKTFQCLGYFVAVKEVPPSIIVHIARSVSLSLTPADLVGYDQSGTRWRHLQAIRTHLRVQPYGRGAQRLVLQSMQEAARVKEDLADLINVAIEELIRRRWELPRFGLLRRAARHMRALVYRRYYHEIAGRLSPVVCAQLDAFFKTDPPPRRSTWNDLKQTPGSATLGHFRTLVAHYQRLRGYSEQVRSAVDAGPAVKIKQFAAEARTLDAGRMQALEPHKRYTLAAALLIAQTAQTLDDLAEMFIKRMTRIHQRGKDALAQYREQHQEETDRLIDTLRDMVTAYQTEGTDTQRLAAIGDVLGDRSEEVLQHCDAHQAYAGNNYYPFLWRFYLSHRATLFRLLRVLPLESTSQDTSLIDAHRFVLEHEATRSEWLTLTDDEQIDDRVRRSSAPLDLSWVPEGWWRVVTGESRRELPPTRLNRRHFEICVFSQLMWDLKSGDLCIIGSEKFADYREQLVSWDEYEQMVPAYGAQVGLPTDRAAFTASTRRWLEEIARRTDAAFPQNTQVRIENGEPVVSRSEKKPEPAELRLLESLLAGRLEPLNILDVLADTEQWLHWTRFFGPISGHDAKLDDPRARYVLTTFCYGCGFGPAQAARSLQTIDRRQLAWINQRHVTVDKLEQVNTALINAYNQFALPRYWGSGKSASADGTKWDLYEQNLLSEYHIRYGGYGGIGYYHIADTYVALFSHFIPCGVWEAVYILDGLLQNQSDIQPDTLHADTHGQSAPVFGLAYLLGINLMPRIRNWKHLKFFRPSRDAVYTHLDALFDEPIDWRLIETHVPDLLRVVLSIKAGRITASTILRKLSTASRKNRLYFAFRELGRVVRTAFLLQYLADAELRAIIHAATNKSETFHRFIQWLFFGSLGVIAENNRDEQRKIVKYTHVVANCLIFHNVQALTRVLQQLARQGYHFSVEVLARLSPYLTEHINRFGAYSLDLNRNVPLPEYELTVSSTEMAAR
jgi:TnpA family transposase